MFLDKRQALELAERLEEKGVRMEMDPDGNWEIHLILSDGPVNTTVWVSNFIIINRETDGTVQGINIRCPAGSLRNRHLEGLLDHD
jgi:hypothetical protein